MNRINMSSEICGNCNYFKPKTGEQFFNCLVAKHAGLDYGMQVRADSRSCDAFVPFGVSDSFAIVQPESTLVQSQSDNPVVGLCSLGKGVLLGTVVLAIAIDSVILYTCA